MGFFLILYMEVKIYEDTVDENGSILIDRYIDFFMKNIQNEVIVDGEPYLEGGKAVQIFLDNLQNDSINQEDLIRWMKDEKLNSIHKKIKEKGMKLCPLNFFTLCSYILTIIKEQYIVLLKPTIADTIAELSDVESISFKNKNGETITTNNSEFIKMVMENIKNVEETEYERDKVIKIDKITNNIVLQSNFIYLVALFLQEYFKDFPRRSNCCMVSAIEQELILYMLYFFKLAPVPLTDSRFRQLVSHYKSHRNKVTLAQIPNVGIVPMQFIKYKDWINGTVDLDKVEPLNDGETVRII